MLLLRLDMNAKFFFLYIFAHVRSYSSIEARLLCVAIMITRYVDLRKNLHALAYDQSSIISKILRNLERIKNSKLLTGMWPLSTKLQNNSRYEKKFEFRCFWIIPAAYFVQKITYIKTDRRERYGAQLTIHVSVAALFDFRTVFLK